jgi:hypothetical protein
MVRLAMLGAAILVPPLIGIVALFLKDPADRAQGAAAKARVVLKGYPFTLGLAVTLVMTTVFAPILKIRTLARRWIGQHVPIMVEADDYEAVIGELQEALRSEGWETRREPASWLLRAPTKVLTWLAGGSIANLVADRLTTLRSDRLEATLHPADLVIEGKEADVVRRKPAWEARLLARAGALRDRAEARRAVAEVARLDATAAMTKAAKLAAQGRPQSRFRPKDPRSVPPRYRPRML